MSTSSIGRVVFSERGYIIAEVIAEPPGAAVVLGYSLVGPEASESIIYGTRLEALEALQDIEARSSGS